MKCLHKHGAELDLSTKGDRCLFEESFFFADTLEKAQVLLPPVWRWLMDCGLAPVSSSYGKPSALDVMTDRYDNEESRLKGYVDLLRVVCAQWQADRLDMQTTLPRSNANRVRL